MGQLQTTTTTMSDAADKVARVNSDVQALLSSLRAKVEMVNGAWAGTARVAFDGLIARWDTDARKLNDALLAISDTIRVNSRNYDETQDAHTTSLNNVGGLLSL
jgi:WXG100 family type VII secretion target